MRLFWPVLQKAADNFFLVKKMSVVECRVGHRAEEIEKHRRHLALLLLLALAGVFRFWNLDGKSLWIDEAKGLNDCAAPLKGILYSCMIGHTAPLREILLHCIYIMQTPRLLWEAASRLPSAFAGMLLVIVIFRLGSRLFGKGAGLCAALFLLVHPWHILHSQDNRMHSVVLLLATLSLSLLLYLVYEKSSKRGWALWGGLFALFAYFTYLAVMPLIAMAGIILWETFKRLLNSQRRAEGVRILVGSLLAAGVFLILYSPWLRYSLFVARLYRPSTVAVIASPKFSNILTSDKPKESMISSAQITPPFTTRFDWAYLMELIRDLGGGNTFATVFALVFALWGAGILLKRHRHLFPVVLFWFLSPLPILLLTSAGYFFPTRYLFFYLAVFSLLVGLGAYNLFLLLRTCLQQIDISRFRILGRPGYASCLAGMVVLGPLLAFEMAETGFYYASEKQDWRGAMNFIGQHTYPGQTLITGDLWAYYGAIAYLNKPLRLAPDTLSPETLNHAITSEPDTWYVYWRPLPPFIREVVNKEMVPVATFPGMLGDVHVMRRKVAMP